MIFRWRWSSSGLRGVTKRWVSYHRLPVLASVNGTGNFMLSLQLRSARDSDLIVLGASQPVSG